MVHSPPYVPSATGRDALAEIDRVGWAGLRHAYTGSGTDFSRYAVPCDDLPKVLGAFFADDEETRGEAADAILASALHQGTIYEVTAAVVPFLAAFAAAPSAPARGRMLSCLAMIAQAAARGDDAIAASTRAALEASRPLLRRGADAGPALARRAMDAMDAALATRGEDEEIEEVADALWEWAEREEADAEPPQTDGSVETELRAYAAGARGAPYAYQSQALGRAGHLIERAPALVVEVCDACDRAEVRARGRALRAQALALAGDRTSVEPELRAMAAEWLGPAKLGGLSQTLARADLLAALEAAGLADVAAAVRAAPEPEVVLPDGETL
jgi:hypothetical protein